MQRILAHQKPWCWFRVPHLIALLMSQARMETFTERQERLQLRLPKEARVNIAKNRIELATRDGAARASANVDLGRVRCCHRLRGWGILQTQGPAPVPSHAGGRAAAVAAPRGSPARRVPALVLARDQIGRRRV